MVRGRKHPLWWHKKENDGHWLLDIETLYQYGCVMMTSTAESSSVCSTQQRLIFLSYSLSLLSLYMDIRSLTTFQTFPTHSTNIIKSNKTKGKPHLTPFLSIKPNKTKPLIANSYPFPESMPTSAGDQIHTTIDLFPSTFHTHHHNKTTFLMVGLIPLLFSHPTIHSLKVGDTPLLLPPLFFSYSITLQPLSLSTQQNIKYSILFLNL